MMDIMKDVKIKVNGEELAAFDNFYFAVTPIYHEFKYGLHWSEKDGPKEIKKVMAGLHPNSYYQKDGPWYIVHAYSHDEVNIRFDIFNNGVDWGINIACEIVVSVMNKIYTVYVDKLEGNSYQNIITVGASGSYYPTPIGA